MLTINLKEFYKQLYTDYEMVLVPIEIWNELTHWKRIEHAESQQKRYYSAYLAYEEGMTESELMQRLLSAEDELLRLYVKKTALKTLPTKQRDRITAKFFLDLSYAEIARMEGVDESAIRRSMKRGLHTLRKILKNI